MNLLDTIYEVPHLLHVTNSDSRKALQATCSQLRHLVRRTTSSVSFGTDWQTSEADARLLASGAWTHSKAMNFSSAGMDANAIAVLSQGDWPLLEILLLSNNEFGASGMEHFSQGRWPAVATLGLSCIGMCTSMLQYLQHATLACLSSLDLSGNHLAKPTCWAELVKGDWPNLTHLDLSCSHLDTSFFGQLKHAKWPLLGGLSLHSALYRVLEAPQGKHEALQGIVQCNWHHLQILNLANCGFDPDAMQTICQAQWSNLRVFDFAANPMHADAVRYLAGIAWSKLGALDLTWCDNDVTAVSHLVQAQWPHLQTLGLNGNHIHVNALDLLVKAQWPLLTDLDLSHNYLGPGPVVRLSSGHELPIESGKLIITPPAWLLKQWPMLSVLNLSSCNEI